MIRSRISIYFRRSFSDLAQNKTKSNDFCFVFCMLFYFSHVVLFFHLPASFTTPPSPQNNIIMSFKKNKKAEENWGLHTQNICLWVKPNTAIDNLFSYIFFLERCNTSSKVHSTEMKAIGYKNVCNRHVFLFLTWTQN